MENFFQSSMLVFILKTPPENVDQQDPYIEHLTKVNIPSKFIPTLQFRFKNLDVLLHCLNRPENYAGILLSSPRCVRAVTESLKNQPLKDEWKSLKCFVVGEATAKQLGNELNLNFEGQSSGNLSNLLKDVSRYGFEKSLLMPVGNLHRSPEMNVNLEKIEVYETCEHEELNSLLKNSFKTQVTNILVFFSPSGVNSAIRYIPLSSDKKFKFIAIGPTTAEEMKKYNLEVDGVCQKPNPESLIELIFEIYGKTEKD